LQWQIWVIRRGSLGEGAIAMSVAMKKYPLVAR
jgi:hypothetical protein